MDKTFWNKLVDNYDTEVFDVNKYDKKKIVKKWINQIKPADKTVADIGCGKGKWLPLLSQKFMNVLALDFSKSFLDYSKIKYSDLKNVKYLNIDMTRKQHFSKSIDLILCVNAILNKEDSKREIYFKNIHRNLKKAGQLILVVPSFESVLYAESVFNKFKIKEGTLSKKPGVMTLKNEFEMFKSGNVCLDNVPTKHYLKEELILILSRTGFQIEKIDKVEYSWTTQIENSPKWLKDPYPWDWIVKATKK